MSDETENEEFEVDLDHPWVHASTVMKPQPVLTSVLFEPVVWTDSETSEKKKACLLTIVDPTGLKTVFIPPQVLHGLLLQGGAIMQQWAQEEQRENLGKILVADKNTERAVIEEQKIHKEAREGRPNHLRGV